MEHDGRVQTGDDGRHADDRFVTRDDRRLGAPAAHLSAEVGAEHDVMVVGRGREREDLGAELDPLAADPGDDHVAAQVRLHHMSIPPPPRGPDIAVCVRDPAGLGRGTRALRSRRSSRRDELRAGAVHPRMTTMPPTDVSAIARIGHDEAMVLTQTEFDRTVALLRALSPSDWARPTDCDRWTVRAVALHLLGAAEANASLPEQIRQMRRGSKLKASVGSPHWWDGANEYQIAKHATLPDDRIANVYVDVAARATATRMRIPRLVRALPILKLPPPVGRQPLGYLTDMGFTRDVWMHRVDLTRRHRADHGADARARRSAGRRHRGRVGEDPRRAVHARPRRHRRRHVRVRQRRRARPDRRGRVLPRALGRRARRRRARPPVTPLTHLPSFGYRGGRPLSLVTRRFASRFGRPTTVPALMTLSSETSDFALEMDSNHSRRLSRQTPTTTP